MSITVSFVAPAKYVWVLTDPDSVVSRRNDPKVVVTSAAYLLFYRRRSDTALGGPFLERLMSEVHSSESKPTSRATSPAGEGRRLDDSSRVGSSSALRGVGAAHQAGGGGSEEGAGVLIARKGIDDNDLVEDLPAYSLRDNQRTLNPRDLQGSTLESMEMDEDEGISMEENVGPSWQGAPMLGGDQPQWSFATVGTAPANNSPRESGGEGEDEDLFAEEGSSTKVAKSSATGSDSNRMADFQNDEGTTHGMFGTPPQDTIPLLDVPEADEPPVAEVTLEDLESGGLK